MKLAFRRKVDVVLQVEASNLSVCLRLDGNPFEDIVTVKGPEKFNH